MNHYIILPCVVHIEYDYCQLINTTEHEGAITLGMKKNGLQIMCYRSYFVDPKTS